MKTKTRPTMESLFPHYDDPAYAKLADIEEIVAALVARRGTAPFKQRLQRAIANISDSLVEYCSSRDNAVRDNELMDALVECRRASNAVEMLRRAQVVSIDRAREIIAMLCDIMQLLIERIHALRELPPPGPLRRPSIVVATTPPPNGAATAVSEVDVEEEPPGSERILDG